MGDDNGVPSYAIPAAFVRGMAIICTARHAVISVIIPVLLDKDQPLSESNMSAILIQVRNRDAAGLIANYGIDEEQVGVFRDNYTLERPYIAIVMELGVRGPIYTNPVTRTKANCQTEKGRPAKRIKTSHDDSTLNPASMNLLATPGETEHGTRNKLKRVKHPRYSIFAYGCTANVYRVIQPNDEPKFYNILQTSNLLNHPRGRERFH
ncbi:hypothetical protein BDQ17DRAFT_1451886 [Cyathus striatus]|nr:hypothetical protein BDQ17DRAFT_1451886 [Cyathus striatus]